MQNGKDAKPLPSQFKLSDFERVEFERQVAVKRWLDARLEIAQRDYNDAARPLAQSYETWAQKLSRRLGINIQDLTQYSFAADGTATNKSNDEQPAREEPPPQQG